MGYADQCAGVFPKLAGRVRHGLPRADRSNECCATMTRAPWVRIFPMYEDSRRRPHQRFWKGNLVEVALAVPIIVVSQFWTTTDLHDQRCSWVRTRATDMQRAHVTVAVSREWQQIPYVRLSSCRGRRVGIIGGYLVPGVRCRWLSSVE